MDISIDNIATTDNLNDGSGILGGWATVNGLFAANSTNTADGLIIAYNGYIDIPRLGGVINDGPANIRITDVGNTAGDVTLGSAGTVEINSLLQGANGGTATLDIGVGNTLRIATGGVLLSSGNSDFVFNVVRYFSTGFLAVSHHLNSGVVRLPVKLDIFNC